jgi:hypothetical protein
MNYMSIEMILRQPEINSYLIANSRSLTLAYCPIG